MERTELMLYVGNMSDVEKAALSHKSVASQRGRRRPNWLGFPHADSSVRNFGTRCSGSCYFSSFSLSVLDTVGFRAQIGCRASPQVRRNGFFRESALGRCQRQSEQHHTHASRPHVLALLTRTVRRYMQRPFLRFLSIVPL